MPHAPSQCPAEAAFCAVIVRIGGDWSAPPPRRCRQPDASPQSHPCATAPFPQWATGFPAAHREGLCHPESKLSATRCTEVQQAVHAPQRRELV